MYDVWFTGKVGEIGESWEAGTTGVMAAIVADEDEVEDIGLLELGELNNKFCWWFDGESDGKLPVCWWP